MTFSFSHSALLFAFERVDLGTQPNCSSLLQTPPLSMDHCTRQRNTQLPPEEYSSTTTSSSSFGVAQGDFQVGSLKENGCVNKSRVVMDVMEDIR